MPPNLVEDVTIWEGTTDCTINITRSSLKADNIRWSKDGQDVSEDRFQTITFSEVRKEDAGTYFEEVDLTCEGINSRQFKFNFTMDVLCKLLHVCDNV